MGRTLFARVIGFSALGVIAGATLALSLVSLAVGWLTGSAPLLESGVLLRVPFLLGAAMVFAMLVNSGRRALQPRDAAQAWLKAHPDASGMHTLVARQYLHSGLETEAREHFWQAFVLQPTDESWSELRSACGDAWPAFRCHALEHLESLERLTPDGRRDVSARVMMLMHDGDLEAACVLADTHALSPHTLETLALHLATAQPEVASRFLRRVVDFELPRAQASPRALGSARWLVAPPKECPRARARQPKGRGTRQSRA